MRSTLRFQAKKKKGVGGGGGITSQTVVRMLGKPKHETTGRQFKGETLRVVAVQGRDPHGWAGMAKPVSLSSCVRKSAEEEAR